MRRTASEVIRDLERRVARLENKIASQSKHSFIVVVPTSKGYDLAVGFRLTNDVLRLFPSSQNKSSGSFGDLGLDASYFSVKDISAHRSELKKLARDGYLEL